MTSPDNPFDNTMPNQQNGAGMATDGAQNGAAAPGFTYSQFPATPLWFPSAISFGMTDMLQTIPYPSVSPMTLLPTLLQQSQQAVPGQSQVPASSEFDYRRVDPLYYNFLHDPRQVDDVQRTMATGNDPNLVNVLYQMLSSVDTSNIHFNTAAAKLTVKENAQHTQLMSALMTHHESLGNDASRSLFGQARYGRVSDAVAAPGAEQHYDIKPTQGQRLIDSPQAAHAASSLGSMISSAPAVVPPAAVQGTTLVKKRRGRPTKEAAAAAAAAQQAVPASASDTSDGEKVKKPPKKKAKTESGAVASSAFLDETVIFDTKSLRTVQTLKDVLDDIFAWFGNKNQTELEEPIANHKLQELHAEVRIAIQNEYFKDVENEYLSRILKVLDDQIRIGNNAFFSAVARITSRTAAASTDADGDAIITDALATSNTQLSSEEIISLIEKRLDLLRVVLRSCEVILTILTAPGISKEVMAEEILDSVFDFIKNVQRKYVFVVVEKEQQPELTAAGRVKKSSLKKKKSLISSVQYEVQNLCAITDLIYKLVCSSSLKEEFALAIGDIVLDPFFVEGLDQLQIYSLNVATFLFSSYRSQREHMLREIILSVMKLNKNKLASTASGASTSLAVRSFKLSDGRSIQTFTSLMLQLIQSCATQQTKSSSLVNDQGRVRLDESFSLSQGDITPLATPQKSTSLQQEQQLDAAMTTPVASAAADDLVLTSPYSANIFKQAKQNKATTEYLQEVFDQSSICISSFCTYFVERCMSNQGSDDGDPTVILDNFVDDLLNVLLAPEFPSADRVLQAIVRTLVDKYLVDKSNSNEKLRAVTMDLLGKVASTCMKYDKEVQELRSAQVKTEIFADKGAAVAEPQSPSSASDSESSGTEEEKSEKTQAGKNLVDSYWDSYSDEFSLDDKDDAIHKHQIKIFAYLSSQSSTKPALVYARFFSLCQWLVDVNGSSSSTVVGGNAPGTTPPMPAKPATIKLSTKVADMFVKLWNEPIAPFQTCKFSLGELKSSARFIALSRAEGIFRKIDSVIKHIIDGVKDEKPAVRQKALKSLQMTIEQGKSLIQKPFVQKVLEDCLHDQAITVRKTAIDLISSCLSESVGDDIQEKSMAPFAGVIISAVNDSGVSVRTSCIRILGRLYSRGILDESQQLQACVHIVNRFYLSEDTSIIDLINKTLTDMWFNDRLAAQAEKDAAVDGRMKVVARQIAKIISSVRFEISDLRHHWFVKLLGTDKGNSKALQVLVAKLVECLMPKENQTQNSKKQEWGPAMLVLRMISSVYPKLFENHFNVLKDRLLAVKSNPTLLNGLPNFLEHLLSTLEKVIPHTIREGDDAAIITFRLIAFVCFGLPGAGSGAMEAAVRGMCVQAAKHRQWVLFFDLIKACYLQVLKHSTRSLCILTLIARYLDPNQVDQQSRNTIAQNPNYMVKVDNLFDMAYEQATQMAEEVILDEKILLCAVIEALSHLAIKKPEILMETQVRTILLSPFSGEDNSNIEDRTAVMKLLKDFLSSLEQKMEQAAGENHDTGVNGTIVNQYLDQVFLMASEPNEDSRLEAAKVIDLVLRYGLCIPDKLTAHCVLLVADPSSQVRDLAVKQLLELEQKHTQCLVQHMPAGIQQMFRIVKSITTQVTPRGVDEKGQSRLRFLYPILHKLGRKERNRIFDLVFKELFSSRDAAEVRFYVEALCYLSYETLDEVCYIIMNIMKHIDLHGEEFANDVNTIISDGPGGMAKKKELLLDSLVDMICMSYMLLFKKFLQLTYGISDSKLSEYEPNALSKAFEKSGVSRYACQVQPGTQLDGLVSQVEQLGKTVTFNATHVDQCNRIVEEYEKLLHETSSDFIMSTTQMAGKKTRGRKKKNAAEGEAAAADAAADPSDDASSNGAAAAAAPAKRGAKAGRGRGASKAKGAAGGTAKRGRKRKASSDEEQASASDGETQDEIDYDKLDEGSEEDSAPSQARSAPITTRTAAAAVAQAPTPTQGGTVVRSTRRGAKKRKTEE